ncbi:MAG TPA: beta-propeller fold lactonase family protein, partial [Urbifossiella sp.]|nr:beta-propeller fold lactonase family protein [Urbifossiella sp.]
MEDRTAPNAAPVASPESYTLTEDTSLSVPARGVLANDTDADGVASGAGAFALVTNQFANTVTRVNLAGTPAVVGTVAVGSAPQDVAVTPDGRRGLVSNANSGTVSVLDLTGSLPTVVATVTVGSQPSGVAISPDGTRAVVANAGGRTFSV